MKVLFFNPARSGQGNIPLNIPLLIAIIKKEHEVDLFDLSDYAIFDTMTKSFERRFFKEPPFDDNLIIKERHKYYQERFGIEINDLGLRRSSYVQDFDNLINKFKPDIMSLLRNTSQNLFKTGPDYPGKMA